MAILVVGSTGKVGSEVVRTLAAQGAEVHALTRDPDKTQFPPGVKPLRGDVLDVDTMRAVLAGASTIFLINPVAKDELAQALVTLGLAADVGVKGIVYVSMLNADVFLDAPHSAAKYAAELMIRQCGLPTTILRPTYFMQNDHIQKDALLNQGIYAMPIGNVGVSMIDIRDLAEVAALELVRRETAPKPLPTATIELVGPEIFTGESAAAIWSESLGRDIRYGGDDLGPLERRIASWNESWLAYDQVRMFRGFQRDGMLPARGAVDLLVERLGRPLRTYRSFVAEMVQQWRD